MNEGRRFCCRGACAPSLLLYLNRPRRYAEGLQFCDQPRTFVFGAPLALGRYAAPRS